MVAPGTAGRLQPYDTAVNKPFKAILIEFSEAYISRMEDRDSSLKWTTSMKRIQTIENVADAFEWLYTERADMIAKAFKDVGLSLATNGSEDHLLSIKGYEHGKPDISDWNSVDKELEGYQMAHEKVPYIGENGEYILADGKPLRNYSILFKAQLQDALRYRGFTEIEPKKDEIIKLPKADNLTIRPGCKERLMEDYIHMGGETIF